MRAERRGPARWAIGLLALGLWCSLTARAGAQVVYRAARPAYGPGVNFPNFTRSEPFFWGNGAAARTVPPPGVGRDYYGASQRFMWPYGYAPARSYGPPLVFGGYLTGPGGRLSYNPFGGYGPGGGGFGFGPGYGFGYSFGPGTGFGTRWPY